MKIETLTVQAFGIWVHFVKTLPHKREYSIERCSRYNARGVIVAIQNDKARCVAQPADFTNYPFAKGGIGDTSQYI